MATQIVIANGDNILLDNNFRINWNEKGNAWQDAWVPNTIHYVIWNESVGQNEIQTKDPATGMMAGNTDLNATSDAVGSTTIADLLSWGTTRKAQIESAQLDYDNAYENAKTKWIDDGNEADMFFDGNSATSSYFDWTKTWYDYDENFS